jgi:pimeloyl-ACP methyl ester carboxylesterase
MIQIAGVELEMIELGQGAPLLFLHGAGGIAADDRFLALLAQERRVFAPSHPGFGRSSLPDWLDSVDDITHLYLELMDRLAVKEADLVGASIGGWIAADLATKTPERLKRLVLIGPVGVKTGPSERLDIPDIFAMPPDALNRLLYHDPARGRVDGTPLTDNQLRAMARNRETLALLTWEPYMHDPKLKHRLHRAAMPALFLRGASDGIVSAAYLERYAALVPDAQIETIPEAGHVPHVEQPEAVAARVLKFLNS